MPDLLLDTDVLVDVARGHPPAVEYLQALHDTTTVGVSVITLMELLVGCRDQLEQRRVDDFVSRFEVLPVNAEISGIALGLIRQYRLQHGLLLPDALVAATALANGLSLVTRNHKHYRFIADLALESPA